MRLVLPVVFAISLWGIVTAIFVGRDVPASVGRWSGDQVSKASVLVLVVVAVVIPLAATVVCRRPATRGLPMGAVLFGACVAHSVVSGVTFQSAVPAIMTRVGAGFGFVVAALSIGVGLVSREEPRPRSVMGSGANGGDTRGVQ